MTLEFKIAAAQIASLQGDLVQNIRTHLAAIAYAAKCGVSVLIFPELSLIGYEPELATSHAITPTDARLDEVRELAVRHHMHVVVGAALTNNGPKPQLGAIHFASDGSRATYAKMHLGGNEANSFTAGTTPYLFDTHGQRIGLSICADSGAPSHPQTHATRGATIYAASMFLNAEWYATDAPRLASYAARHRMVVVMANHATSVGTYVSVGNSAIWAPDGTRLAQADGTENALVIATYGLGVWKSEVFTLPRARRSPSHG